MSTTPSGSYTTTSYSYSTGGWGDLLVSFNGGSITYDEIGNPLTYYDGQTFSWKGRLLSGATVRTTSMSFKYNDEGIRTSKTVGGATTNYYLEGSRILDAHDFANEVKFSVIKNEPRKEPMDGFDVSESGMIAIGAAQASGNKRGCAYKVKERESKRKSRANFLPVIFYYK